MNYITKEQSDKLFEKYADRSGGSPNGFPDDKRWYLMSEDQFFQAINEGFNQVGIKASVDEIKPNEKMLQELWDCLRNFLNGGLEIENAYRRIIEWHNKLIILKLIEKSKEHGSIHKENK